MDTSRKTKLVKYTRKAMKLWRMAWAEYISRMGETGHA